MKELHTAEGNLVGLTGLRIMNNRTTSSGDYSLPGPFALWSGNLMLKLADALPGPFRRFLQKRHSYYQQFEGIDSPDSQGSSEKKWKALQLPGDLKNMSVLDIGCSEGFFSRQAARQGASPVFGIDTRFTSLMIARFLAREEKLPVQHRLAVFGETVLPGEFDVVLCLSVLHHVTSSKNLSKVLSDDSFAQDRATLRRYLATLRSKTAIEGRCVIELPYEYDDPQERESADFERFSQELRAVGFSSVSCLGNWDHDESRKEKKDRIVYVAR